MGSPIIFGGNNVASNLQNAMRMATGKLITDNGQFNLIPYAQFENGLTTGWSLGTASLTSNWLTGAPTFGSGASGNLTLGVNSATPILGTYSLSLASSAATTAGNFVASDQFSIPFQMQGKVVAFKFSYNASASPTNGNFSGTSSNSFGVAFWDATNSVWIQPAGVFNLIQNSGVGISTGTFQPPTTCLAGRFVIYNANASAGAITMLYDDFYVGLQATSQGPAMDDWVAYTPTFTGLGTVSGTEFYSRRVGANLEVRGYVVCGTTTATEMRVSLGYGGVNSNVTTAALTNRSIAGHVVSNTTGAQAIEVLMEGGVSYMTFGVANASNSGYTKMNGNTFFANAGVLTLFASFPIAGWSSNTVQSADTSTRVIEAQYTSTTTSNITTTTQFMDFATLITDNSAAVLGAGNGLNATYTNTWRFVAPSAGFYNIKYAIAATSASSAQGLLLNSIINLDGAAGTGGTYTGVQQGTGAYLVTAICPGHILWCNAGQAISVAVSTNTTPTNWPLVAGNRTSISINLISGPAVVQATDSVNCRYYASATSLSGSLATINWTTKDYDSNNAMASGVYTVPVTGKYHVAAALALSGTFILNNTTIIEIQKNGVAVSNLTRYIAAAVTNDGVDIEDTISCIAGDTIRIQVSNSGTSPAIVSSNTRNFISIFRAGN